MCKCCKDLVVPLLFEDKVSYFDVGIEHGVYMEVWQDFHSVNYIVSHTCLIFLDLGYILFLGA